MHEDVHQMIRQRLQAPECVLDPKRGQHQRVITRVMRGPDFFQAERADDTRVSRDMSVIVPDKSGVPNGEIGEKNGEYQAYAPKALVLTRLYNVCDGKWRHW